MESGDTETRILILEKEMQWAKGNAESIRTEFQELKNGQNRLLDLFLDLYRDMGEFRGHMDERFSSLQARTDERFSELQAHTDAQFVAVQREFAGVHGEIAGIHREIADLHGEISGVHKEIGSVRGEISGVHKEIGSVRGEISGVHKEIGGLHGAITLQTRWILAALLGGAVLYPISLKLMDRLFAPAPPTTVQMKPLLQKHVTK